jgi:hypothetical protein
MKNAEHSRYKPKGWATKMNSRAKLIGICLVSALSGMSTAQVTWAQQTPAQAPLSSQAQSQQDVPPVPGQPTMPPINPGQLPDSPKPLPSNQGAATFAPNPPAVAEPAQTQPTGTAAAEVGKPEGTPVSTPAGAAIAPPRQRQVRSILIKVGAIAGAGIAIGAVAALSAASPARVPGSGTH